MVSRGVENTQAIIGIVMTVLPWLLRLFGVDVDVGTGLGLSGAGGLVAWRAKPTWRV
jgi:hypothetical protein